MTRFQHGRAWLLVPVSCLLSLGLGLVALWSLLPLAYPKSFDTGDASEPLLLSGRDLVRAPAVAWLSDAKGDLSKLTVHPGQGVFRAGVEFDANRYPQLLLDITRLSSNTSVYLLWRTVESPDEVSLSELHGISEGASWHSLAEREDWRGTISEIALMADRGRPRTMLILSSAVFHGATRKALAERSWSQWTRFDPWKMSSPNRYPGARGDVILYPTAAFSAWSCVSLLIFLLVGWAMRMSRPAFAAGALMILFLPWVGLDRLWQSQLDRQVDATRDQFGGLTQARKHERELDAGIQRYAARIAQVLPTGADDRVFILQDSRGHNFWRLRLQFHLLPSNIYNFGHELLPEMQSGDYAVLLGEFGDLRFDATSGLLRDGEQAWQAQLIDRHRYGRVFRLDDRVGDDAGEEGE
ncbi:MAG: hypothetical protein U5L08_10525 [Xanthomonadales bacterium]|nr:hypothetical protein [Xanthomonadales bacterium]